MLGKVRGKLCREMPEGIAVRAGIVPPAKLSPHPAEFRAKYFRIAPRHPRGMRACRGCHANAHSVFRHTLHGFIQLREIVSFLGWLDHRPVEDIQRHNIYTGFLQQLHVLLSCFFRPLLRIIIAAVQHLCYLRITDHLYTSLRQNPRYQRENVVRHPRVQRFCRMRQPVH